jgi:hypothetical protein
MIATLSLFGNLALAASIERIGPAAENKVGFRHLAHNDGGDFVAVSASSVFVGNGAAGTLEMIFQDQGTTFALDHVAYVNIGTDRYSINFELYGTKLAINNSGDFVLASRRNLWVGNVAAKTFRLVQTLEQFNEFEKVSLQDDGYYIALAYKSVYGGHTNDTAPALLVEESTGSFAQIEMYGSQTYASGSAGKTLVAQGNGGDFIVASTGAVYSGNIATKNVDTLLDERWIDVKHVSLAPNGDFVLLTHRGAYKGSID